jgi:hypothetical protein
MTTLASVYDVEPLLEPLLEGPQALAVPSRVDVIR